MDLCQDIIPKLTVKMKGNLVSTVLGNPVSTARRKERKKMHFRRANQTEENGKKKTADEKPNW